MPNAVPTAGFRNMWGIKNKQKEGAVIKNFQRSERYRFFKIFNCNLFKLLASV